MPEDEKLQKVLAQAGLGSRREIERWIEAGRVAVNGVRATLGLRVKSTDRVWVDGRQVLPVRTGPSRVRVLRYNKLRGEVCTRADPEGRPTVFDELPHIRNARWVAIGRLDISTSGLLLFTNSGELAHRIMHPSKEVEREYAVRIFGEVTESKIASLRGGVGLEDGFARFETALDAGGDGLNHWFHVVLKEGRNREVRRLWESQGVQVSRLIRVRYGPVTLPRRLRAGHWEELQREEVSALMRLAGLADPIPDKRRPGGRRSGKFVSKRGVR